jgi:hypothetical protein
MADDDDTIVVQIEDSAKADGAAGGDEAVEALKAQYAELQARDAKRDEELAAARRREADATAAAERARKEATEAKTEAADSQSDAVSTGLQSAQAEADSGEAEYAAAMEKGDFAAAAKAQRKIAKAEARILRLDEAKTDLEARKASPDRAATQTRTEPPPDAFEAHVSKFTEPTARWMREHRDWVTDPKKSVLLTRAHNHALGEGLDPDTAEYFAHVETRIGLRKDANVAGNGKTPPRRGAAPPVAPVNGGGGAGSSGARMSDNEVTLSRREAAAATDGTHIWNYDDPSPQKRFKKGEPIGVQEFARRKRELTKQGAYDKSLME